ncbi:MAG: UDP-diphospho-muramoylpentapeptide beta-N-acetylglucosaminyltransferase [Clostridioides sp.]|jgi:UDP-N-acetylglucosamine:LPS N-acetylglucosamine transferase|nr:UDP-diphospho-muramoylpentapeptide beta-N-acetylglucosaminyltransferase [Clostridioides sp.]
MKVLILTSKFGMGHLSVSNSLAEEINDFFKLKEEVAIGPDEEKVVVEDIFEYMMPGYSRGLYKAFDVFVNKGTKLYNLFYRATDTGKVDKTPMLLDVFIYRLKSLLQKIEPTVIISTFPFCSKLVSRYKDKTGSDIPLVTCITDISSHQEWICKNTDCYLVADEVIKEELIEKGVEGSKILVNGIPVRSKFRNIELGEVNEVKSMKRGKNLLIMGGGLGILPKSNRFYERLNSLPGVRTTVITGQNVKMYDKLYGRYANIDVVGYTDHVDEYMKNADVIVTKPGGITMFEAIHAELPLLVFCPFLPNEINNAEFILDNEIGRVLSKDPIRMIMDIKEMIYDDELLRILRENEMAIKGELDGVTFMETLDYLGNGQKGGAEVVACV